MTDKDKKLLIQELCARVAFNPKIKLSFDIHHTNDLGNEEIRHCEENSILIGVLNANNVFTAINESHNWFDIDEVKLYLRPISSMTHEETLEWFDSIRHYDKEGNPFLKSIESYDWLNAHHFDYRGLIEKGFALEAPEDLYTH